MQKEKKWLIRTHDYQILGPVSKEKIIELINKLSLTSEDEICSGNGYWFYIREKELVERYIFSSEVQGFNPVSEAKDILTKHEDSNEDHDDGDEDDKNNDDVTKVVELGENREEQNDNKDEDSIKKMMMRNSLKKKSHENKNIIWKVKNIVHHLEFYKNHATNYLFLIVISILSLLIIILFTFNKFFSDKESVINIINNADAKIKKIQETEKLNNNSILLKKKQSCQFIEKFWRTCFYSNYFGWKATL